MIHWAVWVMKEFNIDEMEIGSIHIPGRELCAFSQEQFLQKVPNGEILWSHLELLRKCKSSWCFKSFVHVSFLYTKLLDFFFLKSVDANIKVYHLNSDVLASQDQSGGDATVTIDQRTCNY